jgi:molybdopterin-guanine dinucleotide biosynthesis protein A
VRVNLSPLPSQGRGEGEGFLGNIAGVDPSPQSSPLQEEERRSSPRVSISAVLLSGGQSRRMGRDKATILFRGKPLWQIQLDLLHKLQLAEIFVSARTDPAWRPPNLTFVPDDSPSRGPLSGLAATLARIRSSHLLVLAIDMPFMNEDHLRYLWDRIEPGRGVLPMIDNRAEPLVAIYPVEAHVDFGDALSGTDFSLQTLTNQLVKIGKLHVIRVSEEEQRFYWNLNEHNDLDQRPGPPIAL